MGQVAHWIPVNRRWPRGRFCFGSADMSAAARLGLDVLAVVAEGFREVGTRFLKIESSQKWGGRHVCSNSDGMENQEMPMLSSISVRQYTRYRAGSVVEMQGSACSRALPIPYSITIMVLRSPDSYRCVQDQPPSQYHGMTWLRSSSVYTSGSKAGTGIHRCMHK